MITVGSWWVDPHGRRMVVGRFKRPRHGIPENRYGCVLEGEMLMPVWLTETELRAGFHHWRPPVDRTPTPTWLDNMQPERRDVYVQRDDLPKLMHVEEVKFGWIRLSVMSHDLSVNVLDQKSVKPVSFDWGLQLYTTTWLPMRDVGCLKPRFGPYTTWDRITSGSGLKN